MQQSQEWDLKAKQHASDMQSLKQALESERCKSHTMQKQLQVEGERAHQLSAELDKRSAEMQSYKDQLSHERDRVRSLEAEQDKMQSYKDQLSHERERVRSLEAEQDKMQSLHARFASEADSTRLGHEQEMEQLHQKIIALQQQLSAEKSRRDRQVSEEMTVELEEANHSLQGTRKEMLAAQKKMREERRRADALAQQLESERQEFNEVLASKARREDTLLSEWEREKGLLGNRITLLERGASEKVAPDTSAWQGTCDQLERRMETASKSSADAKSNHVQDPVSDTGIDTSPMNMKTGQSTVDEVENQEGNLPPKSKPSQSKPSQSKPSQSKPSQSIPSQSKPSQSKQPTKSRKRPTKSMKSTSQTVPSDEELDDLESLERGNPSTRRSRIQARPLQQIGTLLNPQAIQMIKSNFTVPKLKRP
jgi:hypothetical protein